MVTERDSQNAQIIAIANKMTAVLDTANVVVGLLSAKGLRITSVESCTGGAFADAITNISGSSEVYRDGFVTYSNEAKIALGIPEKVIDRFTVYSLEVAVAMAEAGLHRSVGADIAVGITGSLTRVDPSNRNSITGQVYLGIVMGDTEIRRQLNIPETNRVEAKIHIVDEALHEIRKLLV